MPDLPKQSPNNSALPTRKWMSALITGLGAIAVMYLTTDGWDEEESIALVGLFVERGVAYFTPNRPPVDEVKDYAAV